MNQRQKNSGVLPQYEAETRVTSALPYLQACVIANDHRASMFFTTADVKFSWSVVCMDASPSELCLLLLEAESLELAAVTVNKCRKTI